MNENGCQILIARFFFFEYRKDDVIGYASFPVNNLPRGKFQVDLLQRNGHLHPGKRKHMSLAIGIQAQVITSSAAKARAENPTSNQVTTVVPVVTATTSARQRQSVSNAVVMLSNPEGTQAVANGSKNRRESESKDRRRRSSSGRDEGKSKYGLEEDVSSKPMY
jgi:hypothetical protein